MSKKDWIGSDNGGQFKLIGANNHANHEYEENSFYATEPLATELLLELEQFNSNVWECACGMGHMSEVLIKAGYNVKSSDLIDRGYGAKYDFLNNDLKSNSLNYDIITNPPYKFAGEFIHKALDIVKDNNKIAMFLPIRYLEGKNRKKLFEEFPPKTIYVSSSRLKCAINGDFNKVQSSAVCYAWFIWKKGDYKNTELKWFN